VRIWNRLRNHVSRNVLYVALPVFCIKRFVAFTGQSHVQERHGPFAAGVRVLLIALIHERAYYTGERVGRRTLPLVCGSSRILTNVLPTQTLRVVPSCT
jgi:hypothetical protein